MGVKIAVWAILGNFKVLKFHYFHYCEGPWAVPPARFASASPSSPHTRLSGHLDEVSSVKQIDALATQVTRPGPYL